MDVFVGTIEPNPTGTSLRVKLISQPRTINLPRNYNGIYNVGEEVTIIENGSEKLIFRGRPRMFT